MSTPTQLGAEIRSRRHELGMTQAQVAQDAGVARAFVVDIENGRRMGAELWRVLSVLKALGLGLLVAPLPAPDPQEEVLARLLGGVTNGDH